MTSGMFGVPVTVGGNDSFLLQIDRARNGFLVTVSEPAKLPKSLTDIEQDDIPSFLQGGEEDQALSSLAKQLKAIAPMLPRKQATHVFESLRNLKVWLDKYLDSEAANESA